jgi:hypothetical protein
MTERDRDENGKLTHWKTGRRFLYMQIPKSPLPGTISIGPFKAKLYHKEQKTAQRQNQATCRRCLEKGHVASNCEAPIKCRQCLKSGHKTGDPECSLTPLGAEAEAQGLSKETAVAASSAQEKEILLDSQLSQPKVNPKHNDKERGRSRQRSLVIAGQATLHAVMRRQGSESLGSAKRKQTSESSPANMEKQRRLNNSDDDEVDKSDLDDDFLDSIGDDDVDKDTWG